MLCIYQYTIQNDLEVIKMVTHNWSAECRMNIRDSRVRLTRQLYALRDIAFWEPERLTEKKRQQMCLLQNQIAELRALEQTIH